MNPSATNPTSVAAPDAERDGAAVATWPAILLLVLLPLFVVGDSVFGGRAFVPYDLAAFPPASLLRPTDEVAAARAAATFDVTEVPVWFVPEVELAGDLLANGELPVWNPTARGGAPMHAHGLLGLLYPPNWLMLLVDAPASVLGLLAWISMVIAGLGMFGFLRALGLSVGAATFGAVTFQLSAIVAGNAYFWMRLASLVWLPGALWAVLALGDATTGRRRRTATAALALCIGMPWLAGFPPYAAASTLIVGAFAAASIGHRARGGGRAAAVGLAVSCGVGALLGVLIALPQVLPSLRFFPDSAREAVPTMDTIAGSSFDEYGLLGYLSPDLFGHPSSTTTLPYERSPLTYLLSDLATADGAPIEPNYNYIEYSVFVGTLGLLLAACGACVGRGRHRWFPVAAWGVLALMATFAPGARLLFHLPVVDNVWPMRWMAPATVFVAWLAALGMDRLRLATGRPATVLFAVAALGAVFAWSSPALLPTREAMAASIGERFAVPATAVIDHLNDGATTDRFELARARATTAAQVAGWWALVAAALFAATLIERRRSDRRGAATHRPLRLLPWLLIATTAVQLIAHDRTLTRGQDLTADTWTDVHDFLAAQRRAAADQGGFTIARASSLPDLPAQLPPGPLVTHGVRDLHFDTHYDARSHQPLQRLYAAEHLADKGYLTRSLPDDERLGHPLLDLLGVRYLLSTVALHHAGARTGPQLVGPGGEFFVYERATALPRAWVVPQLDLLADDDAVLAALLQPDFAPRTRALAVAAEVPPTAIAAAAAAADRSVRFSVDRPTAVDLAIGAGPAGWLVLADTWLEGWSVAIDEVPTPLIRGNHAMRITPLPAGPCTVRFRYTAPGLLAGAGAGALGAMGALLLLLSSLRSRPGSKSVDSST